MSETETEQTTSDTEPFDGYDDLTVAQVTDRLASSDDEAVAAVKAYEAAHQDRKGIRDWERPEPIAEPDEPTFTRERLLGSDGPAITGHPQHVIVGALHGDDTDEFTRAQISHKVEAFLARETETEEA